MVKNPAAYMRKYRQSESFKKWYKNNADKERERSRLKHYKQKYGISWQDKVQMYEEQKGLCACCFTPLPAVSDVTVHVEHNHNTRAVRGLVHQECNWIISWVERKPELVELAKTYLKRFSV